MISAIQLLNSFLFSAKHMEETWLWPFSFLFTYKQISLLS